MGCDSPLKGYKNRDTGGIQFGRDNAGEKMEVGCGQCLGCRLDYSRMWAMRIVHESSLYEYSGGNCFITLTYRDAFDPITGEYNELHVPEDWSLHKTHVQKFLKRLRKTTDRKVRYFYAGEYGRKCKHGLDLDLVGCPLCNCGRPHYHMCLFNHHFDDLEAYQSDGGIMRYTSPKLEKLWGYGFVDVGELTFASASYVAGYILKKIGKKSDHHYMHFDLDGVITWIQPEFVAMSRGNAASKGKKCGIGASWYERYKGDIFPRDEVPVPGIGAMKGVPRYYDEILREENPRMYEEMKKVRRQFKKSHAEEYTYDRLMAKHKVKKAKVKMKERKV